MSQLVGKIMEENLKSTRQNLVLTSQHMGRNFCDSRRCQSANLKPKMNRLCVQLNTENTSEMKKYQNLQKTIEKSFEDDTIIETKEKKVIEVHSVGKINREIYKCVTEDVATDEVIITDNQIQHILERHPDAYEKALSQMRQVLEEPDYILRDSKHENTGLIIKNIVNQDVNLQLVLRVCTSKGEYPKQRFSSALFIRSATLQSSFLIKKSSL